MRRQPALSYSSLSPPSRVLRGRIKRQSLNEDDEKEPLHNHIQMKGTHNSYHVEPLFSPTREYMYTTKLLTCRPPTRGKAVRIRCVVGRKRWPQSLPQPVRLRNNMPDIRGLPRYVAEWSNANPSHHPLFIWVEPKDWPEQAADVTPLWKFPGSWRH